MAEETGAFAFADVAAAINAKMLRRHPHVFGSAQVADSAEQTKRWEEIKREERAGEPQNGVLDDVPVGLPALTRAMKLGKRAATVGFDWPDLSGVREKVDEELAESMPPGRRQRGGRGGGDRRLCCSRSRTGAGISSSIPKCACVPRTRASRSVSRRGGERSAIGPRLAQFCCRRARAAVAGSEST